MADWASIIGVAAANLASTIGVAKANMASIFGLDTPSSGDAKSYLFDGSDEFIQADAVVASTGNFDWQTDAQSISVWFKMASATPAVLWSFGHSSQNSSWYYLMVQGETTVDGVTLEPRFTISGFSNTAGLFGKADSTTSPNGATGYAWVLESDTNGINPADGSWHHIVITFSGAGSTAQAVKMYADGNQVGFSKSRSSALDVSDFSIGLLRKDGADDLEHFFHGHIAQLGMWTTELSSGNVSTIYNSGTPLAAASSLSPVHFYRFGDGDTNGPGTLTDYGSGGVDGTGVNLESEDIVSLHP